jgi:hypothetical protein
VRKVGFDQILQPVRALAQFDSVDPCCRVPVINITSRETRERRSIEPSSKLYDKKGEMEESKDISI